MAEVNVGALFEEFELDIAGAIEGAMFEGRRRRRLDGNELVRFFLVAARQSCSDATYEAVAKVVWSLAEPIRATVHEFGLSRDRYWMSAIRRNLPSRLSGWVRASEAVAR